MVWILIFVGLSVIGLGLCLPPGYGDMYDEDDE